MKLPVFGPRVALFFRQGVLGPLTVDTFFVFENFENFQERRSFLSSAGSERVLQLFDAFCCFLSRLEQ